MNQNARFLPTISHTILAWQLTAQTPSLRQKLTNLATSRPLECNIANPQETSQSNSVSNLAGIIQARLWMMMQRKIYDPLVARRLKHTPANGETEPCNDEDECEDLLRVDTKVNQRGISTQDQMMNDLEQFIDQEFMTDDWDLFQDLLLEEDDDDYRLLENAEEMERRAVEKETEEMLLGDWFEGGAAESRSLIDDDHMLL